MLRASIRVFDVCEHERITRLATLHTSFGQNVLADENEWRMLLTDVDLETAIYNYIKSAAKGVMKVLSKMGISLLSCYHGAQVGADVEGQAGHGVFNILHTSRVSQRSFGLV